MREVHVTSWNAVVARSFSALFLMMLQQDTLRARHFSFILVLEDCMLKEEVSLGISKRSPVIHTTLPNLCTLPGVPEYDFG